MRFSSIHRAINPGGGGIGGDPFVQIVVEYDFDIQMMYQDTAPGSAPVLVPDTLTATIGSIGPLVFDSWITTYTVETPQGSDPYVKMSIQLDESGSMIRDLLVERRITTDTGVSTSERIDHLVAYDIPYHRIEGDSTFYRIDVSMPQWIGLGRVDYKEWTIGPSYSELFPTYWIENPTAMQMVFDADPDRYLEIELRQ